MKMIKLFASLIALTSAIAVFGKTPHIHKYDSLGNVKGKYLFPKEDGTDLRILDMNIWEWDGTKEDMSKGWIDAGADCTNEVRSKGFYGLIQAYLPEVICLQEYSPEMSEHLYPLLKKIGYEVTFIPDSINYTPVFYRKSRIKLIETNYHSYDQPYNNRGTKSYVSAVFKHKKNGKKFIVINTHLWWKNEKVFKGSDKAREDQLQLILKESDRLVSIHGCPVFLMGDMNCNLRSNALKKVVEAGYEPAWEIATVFGDLRCGHHKCDKGGFSRRQNKTDDGFGCIDHFLLYDPSRQVEIKVFRRDYAWFTVKLTDHYPNYADIKL